MLERGVSVGCGGGGSGSVLVVVGGGVERDLVGIGGGDWCPLRQGVVV